MIGKGEAGPPKLDPGGADSSRRRVLGMALAGLVAAAARRPAACLALLAALTAAAAWLCIGRLGINADQNAMLSNELPHRIVEAEYHEVFPALYENIVVVVNGPTPEEAGAAASALARRMASATDLFRQVHIPRGPYFEEHALLYMRLDELEDFGDRLARVQPYLSGLAQDGSLRGFAQLMARGVHGAREGEFEPEVLLPVLARVQSLLAGWLSGDPVHFSWAEVVAGRELSSDASQRVILGQPVLDYSDLVPAREPIQGIRRMADELGLERERGYQVRVTGDAALAYEEMKKVESQAAGAGLASFVLVSVILGLSLRSLRLVLATMVTLLAGLVWTAAFAALAIGHLNLISVAFAVLYIGLGVDFGLHLCMRYQELRVAGEAHASALAHTARGVGSSIALCALTTAIGFYAFVPTDFAGVAELGLIAGTGMLISLLLSFTLLPALMSVAPGTGRRRCAQVPAAQLPGFPSRHPRAVASVALALGGLAILALPHVRFDQNPLRVRDPAAESVQVLEELLARGTATPWELNAVAPDLASAEVLSERLSALPTVSRAITVSDFIPANQEEKLALIEDVALFLPPLPTADGGVPPAGAEETREALAGLDHELALWLRTGISGADRETVERFRSELQRFIARAGEGPRAAELFGDLEKRLLGTLPLQLRTLERALSPARVTLETLPADLLERMVSPEGKVRVRIFPSGNLSDNAVLAEFVESVRDVEPAVAGGAIRIHEASRAVVRALRQALTSAVIVIGVLLLLIWRTVGDTALVLAPLALAALLTTAGSVLLGIPFNFADIIVIPLLLGIGVDSGIHLVHRARLEAEGVSEGEDLLATSTARAIVFSAITTISSFGTLAFMSHRGMASLGQLLTLGVTFTVVCNLVVLPALIEWRSRRRLGARVVAG